MEATIVEMTSASADERWQEQQRRDDELASLSAHLSAATARWLELVWDLRERGDVDDDLARYVAFRCGITGREAREYVQVAEALQELPTIRAAFSRGELTFTKVRALTRVATASCEEGLLELAAALTASQLERALRAFRQLAVADARRSHELEYVDYFFAEDGSLILRARLAAEDGTLLVKGLDAARERIMERRRSERAAAARDACGGAAGAGRDVAQRARRARRRGSAAGRACRRRRPLLRRPRPLRARRRPARLP